MNKKFIFGFILGIVLSSSVIYAANLFANNVSYDNTNSGINSTDVQGAIDELYTKASDNGLSTVTTAEAADIINTKTAYKNDGTLITGTMPTYNVQGSITPSTSAQTIETAGKYVNSNITVNAIPSSYKNLTTTTTALANEILSSKTAYNNQGQLITGNLSTTCVSGTYSKPANSQLNINVGFTPTKYLLSYYLNNNNMFVLYDSNINNVTYNIQTTEGMWDYSGEYYTSSNKIVSNIPPTKDRYKQSYNLYYMAWR